MPRPHPPEFRQRAWSSPGCGRSRSLMMKVSTSGYYQRRAQPVTDRELTEAARANTVFDIWKLSRRSYGMPRVRQELRLGPR